MDLRSNNDSGVLYAAFADELEKIAKLGSLGAATLARIGSGAVIGGTAGAASGEEGSRLKRGLIGAAMGGGGEMLRRHSMKSMHKAFRGQRQNIRTLKSRAAARGIDAGHAEKGVGAARKFHADTISNYEKHMGHSSTFRKSVIDPARKRGHKRIEEAERKAYRARRRSNAAEMDHTRAGKRYADQYGARQSSINESFIPV
jgi:hypothetical protein